MMNSQLKFWSGKACVCIAYAVVAGMDSVADWAGFLALVAGIDLLALSRASDPDYSAAQDWSPPQTERPIDSEPPQRPVSTPYTTEEDGRHRR